jgi:hypothetical protein
MNPKSNCFSEPEDIRIIYQTPGPTMSLNKSFLEKFGVENEDFEELMEDWYNDELRHVKKGERYIPTQYLKEPYRLLNTMICRLYGEETNTHFWMEWFPMDYTMVKTGQVFNWENILAFNIFNRAKEAPGMKKPGFYMSSYLIDAICSLPFISLLLNGVGLRVNPQFTFISQSCGM